jgi:DNA-directed RNA polymerase specialized sigma24 family protein
MFKLGGNAPVPATDRDLIEKCKQGSIDAFEQVVNRYQQYAFKIAYGILSNVGDAEDMVQEAFITVHRKINSLREGGALAVKISTRNCLEKRVTKIRIFRLYRLIVLWPVGGSPSYHYFRNSLSLIYL